MGRWVLVGHAFGYVFEAGIDLPMSVEAGVRGPHCGEALRDREEVIRNRFRADLPATTAGSAIADLNGKDAEEWDFVVDSRKKGVNAEAFREGNPGFVPDILGANGTTFGNGLTGRCIRKADISLDSTAELGWCSCQDSVWG